MKVSKNNFVLILIVFLGLFIICIGSVVLPARFFYDANTIVNNTFNLKGVVGSFPFIIWFYNITGLNTLPYAVVGVFQYLICCIMLFKIYKPKELHLATVANILFLTSLVIVAIFLSMPTKEFINFIFSFLIVYIVKNHKRFIWFKILVLVLVFSYFFRSYYVLVGIISVVMFFVLKIKIKNKKTLMFSTGVLSVVFLSLSYGIIKGKYISESTREAINGRRLEKGDTNTLIVSPIDTNTWYGETVGIMYGVYSVNFPLRALKHLSPHILVFVIWQFVLIIYLLFVYDRKVKRDSLNKTKWLFYFGIAYFIIQGLFEPDLGSAIRHKAGIFPFIYFMIFYENFRKELR